MRIHTTPCHCNPTEIKLHKLSAMLEIHFDDGSIFEMPAEYLRVYTQSAEAVGHGPGQDVLQTGKENVSIVDLKPVGNYAIALTFSDGHDSGIYSWDLLYKLGADFPLLWGQYLEALKAAGISRKPTIHN
ncbi:MULTISPECIES: gamma-butyrobetaine hydroxylase-like domain-containing protein [Methylomonas]|uniref:gamma-butyrobetaine hydroxylase-like domain-containing protein n=1 Tax=Methylomonas TaxID=416 RepID=UPI001232CA97|nr:DUF971 domain-containing protein [Methylomonas rhizoryzae]